MSDIRFIQAIADCINCRRIEVLELLKERWNQRIDIETWINIPKVKTILANTKGILSPHDSYCKILDLLASNMLTNTSEKEIDRVIWVNKNDFIFQNSNYDSTLLDKTITEKKTKFTTNAKREIEAKIENKTIYTGKYENMTQQQKLNMKSKEEVNREKRRLELQFYRNFKQRFEVRNMTINQTMIKQKAALNKYVQNNLFKVWNTEETEEPVKLKYSNERWLEWLNLRQIKYQNLKSLKLDKIISVKQLKLLVRKYEIHLIKSKFKIQQLNHLKIAGNYYYYKLCNVSTLGDLIENTFRKEQMNGEMISEIEQDIYVIQTYIHTNQKIIQNLQNINLIPEERQNTEFKTWKTVNWRNLTKNSNLEQK